MLITKCSVSLGEDLDTEIISLPRWLTDILSSQCMGEGGKGRTEHQMHMV